MFDGGFEELNRRSVKIMINGWRDLGAVKVRSPSFNSPHVLTLVYENVHDAHRWQSQFHRKHLEATTLGCQLCVVL